MKYIILIALCFIGLNSISAGTIDPTVADSKYVDYGKKFSCIVKLCGSYEDNSNFCATAVAISDKTLLTAAHVVENVKEAYIIVDDKKFKISTVIINKDFVSDSVGVADIALIFIDESLNLDFYPELYNGNVINKVCSISGFGMTGNFISGANKSDNKKRAGSNIIDYEFKDTIVCSASRPGEKNRTTLEFLIASGDSGGGLFIDGKLAGINSFISATDGSPNSSYRDEAHHTNLSKFIDWIEKNTK